VKNNRFTEFAKCEVSGSEYIFGVFLEMGEMHGCICGVRERERERIVVWIQLKDIGGSCTCINFTS
jgi:hypothetical protein